ncbi:MAG: LamG domain-containing protein, partial [Acidobacteriota bacterium]
GSQAGGFLFKGSTTDPWVAGEKQVYFGDGSLSAASGLRPTFVGWGNGWYVGGSDVAAGTWSHACWVWDHHGGAAGTPRIYINGTDVGLAIDIHGASYEDRPGDTVRIGHDGSDGVDADFAGLVDDVAIFDIALSPSQVQAALRGDYSEFGEEPATPPTAVPENMRGHWPFDEGSGTVTEDVTGRSADGLLEGAAWVTDDSERGTVLDLGAGADDAHVHVPHFVAGLSRGDYSICAWLKPAGSQAGGFLFKGSTTDPWVAGEKQVYFGDGSLSAVSGLRPTFVGWGNGWYIGGSDVAADTWSHACWVWDHHGGAAGTPRIYINGTDVGLAIDIHGASYEDRPGDTVRIGHDGSDGVDADFAGLVDDVAIFDIVLSQGQVQAVMNGDYTEFGEPLQVPLPPWVSLMVFAVIAGSAVSIRGRIGS